METHEQILKPPKRSNENISIEYRSGNTDKILNEYITQIEKEDEIIKRLLKALYVSDFMSCHQIAHIS